LAIDWLRVRRASPMDPNHFVQLGLVSLAESPEERAVATGLAPSVREALGKLPDEQRRAIVLAAVYGRTALEISELESIPLGTAKTRIRAALSKLRAITIDLRSDHEE